MRPRLHYAWVIAVVFVFTRDRPEDLGLLPYGRMRRAARAFARWRRSRRCDMPRAPGPRLPNP